MVLATRCPKLRVGVGLDDEDAGSWLLLLFAFLLLLDLRLRLLLSAIENPFHATKSVLGYSTSFVMNGGREENG